MLTEMVPVSLERTISRAPLMTIV